MDFWNGFNNAANAAFNRVYNDRRTSRQTADSISKMIEMNRVQRDNQDANDAFELWNNARQLYAINPNNPLARMYGEQARAKLKNYGFSDFNGDTTDDIIAQSRKRLNDDYQTRLSSMLAPRY